MRKIIAVVLTLSASTYVVYAQRGGGDWTTAGNDAQRSRWVKSDPKINKTSIASPDFRFLWKVKTANQPSPAITLNSYIGYRGFRSLAFVVGTSDNVTAFDTDLGRLEWQKSVGTRAAAASAGCSGLSTGLARPSAVTFPGPAQGGRGGGRGSSAKSGVGEAGDGAVTIAEIAARAAAAPPRATAAGRGAAVAAAGRGAAPPGTMGAYNPFARAPSYLYLLSNDGMLHAMYLSNGEEPNPPVKFLPPGVIARGLIVVDNVAYATAMPGCGAAADQLWALDLASNEVNSWKAPAAGIMGTDGMAFGPDATIYLTAGDVLMSLEPKTLKPKEAYKAGAAFTSSPVVFQYKGKTIIAAASKDGQVHMIDAATPAAGTARSAGDAVALASWQDPSGTRWLLGTGPHSVTAWKVADENGALVLQQGWTSRDLLSPLPAMVIDGVVFTGSGGSRSSPAVLYALDGTTGQELWSSGKSITSYVQGGGLAGGASQLYLGTVDGSLYAFGFWIEH